MINSKSQITPYKILIFLTIISFSPTQIRLAVSSNLMPVFNEIKDIYESEDLIISYASSGQLFNQIINRFNIDIFFSADTTYPNRLYQNGHSNNRSISYCTGSLVYFSKKHPIDSNFKDIKSIIIADTLLAPYGRAANEVIKKKNLLDRKIIYGINVGQVNSYLAHDVVDLGITSKSFLSLTKGEKKYWQDVNVEDYSPIIHQYIKITNSKIVDDFLIFFKSEIVNNIFIKHGYHPIN